MDPRNPSEVSRRALDILSLMYCHGPGKEMQDQIEKLDADVPDWQERAQTLPQEDQRRKFFYVSAWSRAIKLLKEFKRI